MIYINGLIGYMIYVKLYFNKFCIKNYLLYIYIYNLFSLLNYIHYI